MMNEGNNGGRQIGEQHIGQEQGARTALGRLGDHLRMLRRTAPGERLLVLVDVDGTLLAEPGNERTVGSATLGPAGRRGLMEALRWLQIHPSTFVALVSERGPGQRAAALEELRQLAGPGHHAGRTSHAGRGPLRFGDDLLALVEPGASGDAGWRLELLTRYASLGFRIGAALVRDARVAKELRGPLAAEGALTLGPEAFDELGSHDPAPDVALAGRGLATQEDLQAFLGSSLGWGEVRLVGDGRGDPQVAGEDGTPGALVLEELAGVFAQFGKGLRLDLGGDARLALRTLQQLERSRVSVGELTFCAPMESLAQPGHRALAEAWPQAPWIANLNGAALDRALDGLDRGLSLLGEGRTRLRPAVAWDHPERDALVAAAQARGLGFEFDEPGDLLGYLEALGRGPASISGALPTLGARTPEAVPAALPRARTSRTPV